MNIKTKIWTSTTSKINNNKFNMNKENNLNINKENESRDNDKNESDNTNQITIFSCKSELDN